MKNINNKLKKDNKWKEAQERLKKFDEMIRLIRKYTTIPEVILPKYIPWKPSDSSVPFY